MRFLTSTESKRNNELVNISSFFVDAELKSSISKFHSIRILFTIIC